MAITQYYSNHGDVISVWAQRIQYAKSKSDCVSKAEGTYVQREKKMKQEEKVERKLHAEETQQPSMANGATAQNGRPAPSFQQSGQDTMPPNNILFIQNLPIVTTSTMLQLLFEQYPGFKEIRMIEAKPGIAFVEYEDCSIIHGHAGPSGFQDHST